MKVFFNFAVLTVFAVMIISTECIPSKDTFRAMIEFLKEKVNDEEKEIVFQEKIPEEYMEMEREQIDSGEDDENSDGRIKLSREQIAMLEHDSGEDADSSESLLAKFADHNHQEEDHEMNDERSKSDVRAQIAEYLDEAMEQVDSGCIQAIEVYAKTGSLSYAGTYIEHKLQYKLQNGGYIETQLPTPAKTNQYYSQTLYFSSFSNTPSCVKPSEIVGAKLLAGGSDGWYLTWFKTVAKLSNGNKVEISNNPYNMKRWLDTDEQTKYGYDASSIDLFLLTPGCMKSIEVYARTGNKQHSGTDANHILRYKAQNGYIETELPSPAKQNEYYRQTLSLSSFSNVPSCLKPADIVEAKLIANGNDGWYLNWFKTIAVMNDDSKVDITDNPYDMKRWLDSNEPDLYKYDATYIDLLLLSAPATETPHCGYGVPTCECRKTAKTCVFNLEIDEIMTFTRYTKFGVGLSEGLGVRGAQGVLFNINGNTGEEEPHPFYTGRPCADLTNKDGCTDAQFVDGINYRMAIGVNGQIPGPTIIVHEGQEVVIHVHNNMSAEGISIHWHGMHQKMSPWMDGVGQVTQCQIGPSSSYSYNYLASPAGTFWYHSHSGAQRTDGFFGTLIVKESEDVMKTVLNKIKEKTNGAIEQFDDFPNLHSINVLDWSHDASLEVFSQLNAGLGFFPESPPGEVPNSKQERYESARSNERAEIGPVPFFSGLINGKGSHKHDDESYSKTRLSTFPVKLGNKYRFRLIGSQGLYAFKFSIDGHKLSVVATDGYWTEPVRDVDFIIIHTGERYDFIVEANQPPKNYWMRAETLETILPKPGELPPYKSRGHVAEAILQYTSDVNNPPNIKSTDYYQIKLNSPSIQCSKWNRCKAVNCPFKNYHPNYYTQCVNIQDFRLLLPTPSNEMPDTQPCTDKDCTHFINFNFEGDSETSSVNGRNFLLPPSPPQTQYEDFEKQSTICDLSTSCNPGSLACSCTHMLSIPYDKTVQIVLTALGAYDNAHPIHLHGHTFHVVEVGYPEYDSSTGFIAQRNVGICDGEQLDVSIHNKDISCDDSCPDSVCPKDGCNPYRCTKPHWTNNKAPSLPTVNEYTIRKDTVMLPAGGYVVINFKSDNPGMWFLHCHIEVHQLEGMAVIINEAFAEQQKLTRPENLNKCGDYSQSIDSFKEMKATSQRNVFKMNSIK